MSIYIAVAMGGAFIAGGGFAALYFWADRNEKRIRGLEQIIVDLKEQLSRKQHTYSTSNGLLNIQAMLNYANEELIIAQMRVSQAKDTAGKIYNSPILYNADEPAGPKPAKKAK